MESSQALTQPCLPERHLEPPQAPYPVSAVVERCEEEELYRCSAGAIVDCQAHVAIASCARGCIAEGAFIDAMSQISIEREAAYAILCSR
jgi:hypothetical protein